MKKSLPSILRSLQTTQFLDACENENGKILITKLLPNGEKYCEQLVNQWKSRQIDGFHTHLTTNSESTKEMLDGVATGNRLDFITSQIFLNNLSRLRDQQRENSCYAALKTIYKFPLSPKQTSNDSNQLLEFKTTETIDTTFLATDYLIHPARGLEKFYNIQRERKIWWMRLSANPSRYFLEPYGTNLKSETQLENKLLGACQSITIKSRFTFGITDVEQITLVQLEKGSEDNREKYLIRNERGNEVLPAIIRSVIQLEKSACALLIDANDNNRAETLLLNRKLAPYQCALACLHADKNVTDLKDLCTYLTIIIRRAGLRICGNFMPFTNFEQDLEKADSLGIPYFLLINEETLQSGLLKLRSRDTTLAETIHISDIPNYLINIFKN